MNLTYEVTQLKNQAYNIVTNSQLRYTVLPPGLVSIDETSPHSQPRSKSVTAFYEKVIKVKADVAAFLINCFPSA